MKWRQMSVKDIEGVIKVAASVHPNYPEDAAVFIERLSLFPTGCFALPVEDDIVGYAISHPWHRRKPPKLNSLLGKIPDRLDCYYLHDIALLPGARGKKAGTEILTDLLKRARISGFAVAAGVSVNNSLPFVLGQGFVTVDDPDLANDLKSYDGAARYVEFDLSGDQRSLPTRIHSL